MGARLPGGGNGDRHRKIDARRPGGRIRAAAIVPAWARLCCPECAVSRIARPAVAGHGPAPSGVRPFRAPGRVPYGSRSRLSLSRLARGAIRAGRCRRLVLWRLVALETAVRSVAKIAALVLIDTLGLKFGGREARDIADIYALPEEEVRRRTFVDPARFVPDYASLGEDELNAIACDRHAAVLYGWRPYMHNPGLKQWLHRVATPSLVLWGEQDGIVAPDYGERVAAALPKASFRRVPQAGHYPQIERPEAVADMIESFVRSN